MLDVRLTKTRPGFRLDAAFQTESGNLAALFGRSGCGKTTLINLLAGLERPDAGRIEVDGVVLFDSARDIDLPPERRGLGYVFQDARLFPHMSVRRNLAYGMDAARAAGRRGLEFDQAVGLLGLAELLERRPGGLSGGERQRVAIGRALLARPRLLLMDEPLASLDHGRKNEIIPYLERLRDTVGSSIVYVSHAMDEIVRLADTLVLMSDGRVVAAGPIEDLTSRLDLRPLTGRYEAGAVIQATVAGYDEASGLTDLAFAGGRLRVPGAPLGLGEHLRLRIRARDVSLALEPPTGISILNVLPGTILEIADDPGPQVDVRLDIGVPILARLTRFSVRELALAPGRPVHAMIKAIAFDRHSLGGLGGPRS